MSPAPTAADLMRTLGLDVDGPARWGTRPTSQSAGVFVIETASPRRSAPIDVDAVRRWLERVPTLRLAGERPTETVLARHLASFWMASQTLLYVGHTSRGLAGRVAALYATELGHRRPHPGGHWLKTLRDHPSLRLWWAETDAAEEYEDALLGAFSESVSDEDRASLPHGAPLLPWANLASPAGLVRDTGLTGSLLDADAAPARTSSVRRSDPAGAIRRRTTVGTSTARSPRSAGRQPAAGRAARTPKPEQATHLTAAGLAAVEAELERLTRVDRPAVVERIKHARELGDLRENADYEAARREQSFLEGRILELEQRLRTAVLIESGTSGSITLGSIVRYEIDGQPGQLTIVGSAEADPATGRISAASPVGKALLGRRVGDEVVVVTPAAEASYRVIEVD